jgi:hypothetical protein
MKKEIDRLDSLASELASKAFAAFEAYKVSRNPADAERSRALTLAKGEAVLRANALKRKLRGELSPNEKLLRAILGA